MPGAVSLLQEGKKAQRTMLWTYLDNWTMDELGTRAII